MTLVPAEEGSKLYSYLLNGVHNLDPNNNTTYYLTTAKPTVATSKQPYSSEE